MGPVVDADGNYYPSHLSPSQLTAYSLCPVLYRERYVLRISPPPQPERLFGIAVHAGLEAQFRGEDDERTFLRIWREHVSTLDAKLYPLLPALRARGLQILEMVRELALVGEPERLVTLTRPGFKIPFLGYCDLWSVTDGVIYDFKTAAYGWTQSKADQQLFQPAVYSQAYVYEHAAVPSFKFVVLPRVPAPVQVIDATRTPEQIDKAFREALRIHVAIENQEWGCTCKGRYHLFGSGASGSGHADFEDDLAA